MKIRYKLILLVLIFNFQLLNAQSAKTDSITSIISTLKTTILKNTNKIKFLEKFIDELEKSDGDNKKLINLKKKELITKKNNLLLIKANIYDLEEVLNSNKKKHKKNITKKDTIIQNNFKVFLETDIGFASSANDTRKEASSGVGTLGLKFEYGYFYGNANFRVYSQNQEANSKDNLETKIFGTNLLLPENSSSNISNFSVSLGLKRLFKQTELKEKLLTYKKIGVFTYFKVNNTTWIKGDLSIPTTINSFGLDITYQLFDLNLLQNGNERVRLFFKFGLASRRLGGDYGIDINKENRNEFIGTEKLGFNGTNLGIKLEVGKFYGIMNLTSFSRKTNILGFSGNQAIVSLGINADLNITKNNNPK